MSAWSIREAFAPHAGLAGLVSLVLAHSLRGGQSRRDKLFRQ